MSQNFKGTNVLGLCSTGHGAAVSLVSQKHGVRAMTLDRFTGHKHSLLFTRRELADITSGSTPIDKSIFDALQYSYRRFPRSYTVEDALEPFLWALFRGLPLDFKDIDLVVTSNCHFAFNAGRSTPRFFRGLFPNAQVFRDLEHHTIHQWQAFLPSGFSKAAILTLDESGEGLARLGGRKIAMTMAVARDRELSVITEFLHPDSSPGLLYAEVCRHLNYHAGEEGKLMGLAPFGTDRIYRQLLPELKLMEDGGFRFLGSDELCTRLHKIRSKRQRGEPIEPVHADMAYAAQTLLEDILVHAMQTLARLAPADVSSVCVSGGVGLNSCANEKMFRASRFRDIYISPNPGDDGHALACALYGARVLAKQSVPASLPTDYLGPVYSDDDIHAAVMRDSVELRAADPNHIASMLAAGKIVALYQGGSEYGPRALGNRSILADPRNPEMTNIVNERVKQRELFRPYAPVVLEEKVHHWFDHSGPNRFMLRVVPVLPEKREQLGAVTHIDGSARVQTVTRETNPQLYAIIEAFERRTGIPVLLNTSFNLAGKPIVETPEDAVQCFLSTGLDALIGGKVIAVKPAALSTDAADSGADPITPAMRRARNGYQILRQHAQTALAQGAA
jgi:carbamoyltransferase